MIKQIVYRKEQQILLNSFISSLFLINKHRKRFEIMFKKKKILLF